MTPGGGKEEGETDIDCVIRETSEETGYIIHPTNLVLTINEFYNKRKYETKYFCCEILSKNVSHLTEKEQEVGMIETWLPLDTAVETFSKYDMYSDEMQKGLYLREYTELKNIFKNK